MDSHAYMRDHINSITLCTGKSWYESTIECIIWCDDLSARFIHVGYDRYEKGDDEK